MQARADAKKKIAMDLEAYRKVWHRDIQINLRAEELLSTLARDVVLFLKQVLHFAIVVAAIVLHHT